jgi:hypothetical protein
LERETMTDPRSCNTDPPFPWAVENLHTTKVPWVTPIGPIRSRPGDPERSWKRGEETRKFLTPSPEEGPRQTEGVSEKPIKRKKET